jgi:hypothetical protein
MDTVPETKRHVGRLIDAGIVIVALLVGFYVGRSSSASPAPVRTAATPRDARSLLADPIGRNIALPGVDFRKNQRTLVLALQTTCRFCTESGSFYQRLVRERVQFGGTRLVAVLPQTVEDSQAYLSNLGVAVDDVIQGSLLNIGVSGTPTLLLVNGSGVVTEAWSRKLHPAVEEAVLARLRISN